MAVRQRIDCEVTFLSDTKLGPLAWPKRLSGGTYRPHLVVGDPGQREAKLATRTVKVERPSGSFDFIASSNFIDEEMLGVAFEAGPPAPKMGSPLRVTLSLMFWPHTSYEALKPGATFTIREGGGVVGYGTVLSWYPPG